MAATCGVYWAPSTIPNAGMGLFAGKDFPYGQVIQKDMVIPVVDLLLHNKHAQTFLFEDYWWSGETYGTWQEGVFDTPAVSFGFGAAANAYLPLTNVAELFPANDNSGLHRARNPGAGASTYYHGRRSIAEQNITKGQEFFVDYGSGYFRNRPEDFGRVPLLPDHDAAENLLQQFYSFEDDVGFFLAEEVWDTFVTDSAFESRVFGALDGINQPSTLRNTTLTEVRRLGSQVDDEYLKTKGVCADHLVGDDSTIPEAGKGAFARRFIPKGSIVAPMPVIHVPYRNIMDMYELDNYTRVAEDQDAVTVAYRNPPNRQQLSLNYCMGHSESTLLLCPYGSIVGYINHNKTQANVKLRWADPGRSHHNPDLFNKSVEELKGIKVAELAFELVALEDLQPKQEIFLDYGDEWEKAWQYHVKLWKTRRKDQSYTSAIDMNRDLKRYLKTEFEAIHDPYPSNVELKCYPYFLKRETWEDAWKARSLDDIVSRLSMRHLYDCDILSYRDLDDGERLYSAVYFSKRFNGTLPRMRQDLPKQAFRFFEAPYTADWSLEWAFRHEIGIPDELLPDSWRNLRV